MFCVRVSSFVGSKNLATVSIIVFTRYSLLLTGGRTNIYWIRVNPRPNPGVWNLISVSGNQTSPLQDWLKKYMYILYKCIFLKHFLTVNSFRRASFLFLDKVSLHLLLDNPGMAFSHHQVCCCSSWRKPQKEEGYGDDKQEGGMS